jgi:50S ribosomal protein L4
VHESVRAELNARRRAPTRPRPAAWSAAAAPSRGARRARAAPAPARAGRPCWTGGGTVFGPTPRHYTSKVNRKEKRAAFRSALSVHAERGTLALFDPAAFETPSAKSAFALLGDWGVRGSVLVILTDAEAHVALSFRNLEQVRGVLPAEGVGVADLIGAANVLASPAASTSSPPAPRATPRGAPPGARRGGLTMDPSQVIIRPVVSEKSYVLATADKYTFRVHPDAHKTQIRQAVEQLFDVHVVGVRTVTVRSKPKRRGITRGRTRAWKKAIVQVRAGETIPIFQGLQGLEG